MQVQAPPAVAVSRDLPEEAFSTLPLTDRFAIRHAALCDHVLHLRIPDGTVLGEPVVVSKTMGGAGFFEHVIIDVGRDCKLAILESLDGQGSVHSGGAEIRVGEGSSLLFGSIQNLSPATDNLSFRTARVAQDASLEWVLIDTGGRVTLSRIDGRMVGRGAKLTTKLMAFSTGSQHVDLDVTSVHAAPDTASDIIQRAVLDGQAKMIINGLVKIQKNAPRANGTQKEDTLLLSPAAEAAPIPALEIDNNDVRCSHATTVGQIDRNVLFYLMTRGLDEEQATRLVVTGFFEPLVAGLPLPALRADVAGIIARRLEERA